MQSSTRPDHIRDIQDGCIYQNALQQPRVHGKRLFSVVVSCDGAPLIKSRKFSIWPLMSFLVELPPVERYKFENILLTGLWFGQLKPNIKLFLANFTNELSSLGKACEFEDGNGKLIPSICRIQSVVPDLPAKSLLFNIKQYNGKFGCSTCTHPGRYDNQVHARLYEYSTSSNVATRTAHDTRSFAEIAESTGIPVFGIKGKNIFGRLVDIPDNLPIDWMHCVCEGIMKRQLFKRWLETCYSGKPYSLLGFASEIDEMYLSIKVPHDFTRKPRSIAEVKHWKASEFRLFVLFSGLACLREAAFFGEFHYDHLYHFGLLSSSLRYLHSVPVEKSNVEKAQIFLDNFVRLLPKLYDVAECTYNSHALIHFPSQVLDHGSLSFTSAFVFEGFIAHLKNLFTGTRGLPKQIVKKLGVTQTYKRHVLKKCENTENAAKFAKELLYGNPQTRCMDGGILLHEPFHYKKLSKFQNTIDSAFHVEPNSQHLVSYRMTKHHVTFHSTMYPRKGNSCSYLVEFNSNGSTAYGKVVCYVVHENVAYALIEEWKKTGRNVCQDLPFPQDPVLKGIVERNLIGEHYLEVKEDSEPLVVSCHEIVNRCLYVKTGEARGFITALDTPYEHD